MNDPRKSFEEALKAMEAIQTQIGDVQVSLLEILTDDEIDHWDEVAQAVLIDLENLQGDVGRIQIKMIQHMLVKGAGAEPDSTEARSSSSKKAEVPIRVGDKIASTETPPSPAADLKVWLEQRKITIKGVRPVSGIDAAADQLALYLGEKFATLADFYDYAKRRVTGHRNKWYSVKDLPGPVIGNICAFCTKLLSNGFLSDYRYVKRDSAILFVPVEDGRVKNFFTGAWLERYVLQLIKRLAKDHIAGSLEDQVWTGVEVSLPNGTDAEFDILVSLAGGKVLWIECKTGRWQTYIERYRDLSERLVRLPPSQAALVLLQISDEGKASASALTQMTVLNLKELPAWLAKAIH